MKILIGSCGGLTGLYLAKHLKNNFFIESKLYGTDFNDNIPTKIFLEKVFKVPLAKEEKSFLEALINILNNNKIDIYLPTHSTESFVISKNEKYIRDNTNARFIISPYSTFELLNNKKKAYKKLKEIGLDVPEIYESIDNIAKFPVFTKPEIGSGSKDSFILNDIEECKFILSKYKNNFLMEYISGIEYTIDCIFSKNGDFISYNQRIREKTLGGAVVITKNNFDVDFKEEIVKISNVFKIKGPCNFQFFYNGERKVLVDINLRFASGGLPLSIESNVKIVEIMIRDMLDMEIDKKDYQSDRKNRTLYRYFEEYFEVD